MQIVVAVITHIHDDILPTTRIAVGHIVDDFVNQYLCITVVAHREASYRHILLVAESHIHTLAVIEQRIETIVDIAVEGVKRILALKAKQVVIGTQLLTDIGVHTVVPHAVAEQQQVFRHICIGLRTIVEHLQITTIGIGIGGSAGKLIKQFVGRNDAHPQTVVGSMEIGQSLCLFQQFLTGRNDDNHICSTVGMMVLVRDTIYQVGCSKRGR